MFSAKNYFFLSNKGRWVLSRKVSTSFFVDWQNYRVLIKIILILMGNTVTKTVDADNRE